MAAALVMCIALVSCERSNPVAPEISLAAQLSFSEEKIDLPGGEYIYRQGIQVISELAEGNQFSWRVRTHTGNPLPGTCCDEEGWLWFRSAGADPELPLSEPGAHRSLWTTAAGLDFDLTSQDGSILNLVTGVEVRVKTPQGRITEHSSPFRSSRIISSQISVPFANGDNTGCGITFQMQETIGDIYVEGLYADHFMYRLNILDANLQVVSSGIWYSSLESPDLRRVVLNSSSTPQLAPNTSDTFTQFEMYVVTRQGIQEADTHSVHFRALESFAPVTNIYSQQLCGLGQYHYSINPEYELNGWELIPAHGNKKNRRLWDNDGTWEAINSPDFKFYLHFGYKGQYGMILPNGGVYISNSPFDNELNMVQNEQGVCYYSSIEFYDLRLNGAPFPALGQFVAPFLVTDTDGTTWLRVRNLNREASRLTLSGLADGLHQLEVRAVDSQGVYDPTPAMANIHLFPFKPWSQRSGILVIDDTPHNSSLAPETVVNTLYLNSVPTGYGPVDWVEVDAYNTYGSVRSTQLQNYKAALWFADNPSAPVNLFYNVDALEFYLGNQGRLVISSTNKLATSLEGLNLYTGDFVSERLGLAQSSAWGILSSSLATNSFFVQAVGLNGLSDIELNLTSPFNALVNARQGLSTITYFNPETGLDFLYGFGCKAVDAPVYPPTQEQYDLYSSKFVGYRHQQNGASVVLLGFPLSYMEPADVAVGLSQIFAELIGRGRIR